MFTASHRENAEVAWDPLKMTGWPQIVELLAGAVLEENICRGNATSNRCAEGAEYGGVWGGVSPPQPTSGSGGTLWAPPAGSGWSPGRKSILAYFEGHRTFLFASICWYFDALSKYFWGKAEVWVSNCPCPNVESRLDIRTQTRSIVRCARHSRRKFLSPNDGPYKGKIFVTKLDP